MEHFLPYIDVVSKLSAPALVVLIVIFLTINHSRSEERDSKIYTAFIVMIQGVLDNFSDTMRDLVGKLSEHDQNAQKAIKGIANLEEKMSEAQKKMSSFAAGQATVINSASEDVKLELGIRLTEIANRLVDLQEHVSQISTELITLSSDLEGAERRLKETISKSLSGEQNDRNPEQHSE